MQVWGVVSNCVRAVGGQVAPSLMRLLAPAAVAIALLGAAPAAKADTIAQYLVNNAQTCCSPFGQSVTTTGTGPWTSISFNFYDASNNAYAAGNLYLLTQEYTGRAGSLSTATPGYVAQVAATGGTSWVFDPSVTLQPNTQYFFYMNSTPAASLAVDSAGGYAGGTEYSLNGTTFSAASGDLDFTLSSAQASPGPIPGSGLLSYLLLGFGGAAFHKRLRARFAALREALRGPGRSRSATA
jgi:hypothetical protein